MKRLLLVLVFLSVAVPVRAQAATVVFDYPVAGSLPTTVQGWTATLYVNNVPFVVNDICTPQPAPTIVTCTATLPDVSSALAVTGPNQFIMRLKDGILEGPNSVPLVLSRPSATSAPRIQ